MSKWTAKSLCDYISSRPELLAVTKKYPFRITSHIASLIKHPGDPLWLQFVPDSRELENDGGYEDPLGEESLSPLPNLVHRYPDRVLWIVTSECAAYCRFCTRKRLWNKKVHIDQRSIRDVVEYLRHNKGISEVLVSGGDPLLIRTAKLREFLSAIRHVKHISVIRVGTRLPIVSPQSITRKKMDLLREFQPLYVMLHINHPSELNDPVCEVLSRMADCGIPMASQTVLLRGVNDRAEILRELFVKLLALRVRPYYLLQADLMKGTSHFRAPISEGLRIMFELRHRTSGLAIPHYMVDLPEGGGKIELTPSFIEAVCENRVVFRNRLGKPAFYPLFHGEKRVLRRLLLPRLE